jgi:hypothetical protein
MHPSAQERQETIDQANETLRAMVTTIEQEAYNAGRADYERTGTGDLSEHVKEVNLMLVGDLPALSGVGILDCPLCHREVVDEQMQLSYDVMEKLRTWTVGQLIAWAKLQKRSGIDALELLERTSGGVMPGIGGAINGDTGTIGVSDLNGIFVGIEPDGYAHS